MDGATSPDVREVAREMDSGLTDVMPDSWVGHARQLIFQRDDLSDRQIQFAEVLAGRLLEKGKTSDAKTAARSAIKQAKKNLD